jgi:hypothetical protein
MSPPCMSGGQYVREHDRHDRWLWATFWPVREYRQNQEVEVLPEYQHQQKHYFSLYPGTVWARFGRFFRNLMSYKVDTSPSQYFQACAKGWQIL